jgi:c-di-AMP phosphodiesterase-like protein
MNPQIFDNENYDDNITTIFNCLVGATFIMKYWESESKENFDGKRLLEEKEENLKEILNLFPSAILFYNQKEGIIYKNKYFKEIIEGILKKLEKKLKENGEKETMQRNSFKLKSVLKKSIDPSELYLNNSIELLSKFVSKDEKGVTLSDDLESL